MKNNNVFERNPKKTILVFVLIVTALADFTAGTLKAFADRKIGIPHPYYHHDMRKLAAFDSKWGEATYKTITNSLGFKDASSRQVSLEPRQGTPRLLIMGDSFTEGVGMPYEKTFAGLLDEKLGRENWEVLNAAVQSYSPYLYYLKTRYLVEKVGLKFDRIYVFIDISDAQDEVFYRMDFTPQASWGLAWRVRDFLKRHSVLFASIEKKIEKRRKTSPSRSLWKDDEAYCKERPNWASDPDILAKWGRRGLASGAESMDSLLALCREKGIKMAIAVYPWPKQVLTRDLSSVQAVFWGDFARSRGLEFINLFPDFIGGLPPERAVREYFIPGDVHWSESGHRLIADRVYKHVKAAAAARPGGL